MSKNIVHSGQTFLNKVLEQTGDIENVMEMALLNNVSITDDVVIGGEFLSTPVTNNQIVNYFSERKPANKKIHDNVVIPINGIGYMKIESTFKVS